MDRTTTTTWHSFGWNDYELLDFGSGKRLERFGTVITVRPDVHALSKPVLPDLTWKQADAQFCAGVGKPGQWQLSQDKPQRWSMQWRDCKFWAKLTPTKHLGVFPEQSVEWQCIHECVSRATKSGRTVKVLNLFAYTGIASLVAADAGAEVVMVDASRPALNWFRENQELSNLLDKPIRIILDDVSKFLLREEKRGHTYDIILLDPPAYGNGPHGEKWRFEQQFIYLLGQAIKLLSERPLLMLINAYADVATPEYIKHHFLPAVAHLQTGQSWVGRLALKTSSGAVLPTGTVAYWQANNFCT